MLGIRKSILGIAVFFFSFLSLVADENLERLFSLSINQRGNDYLNSREKILAEPNVVEFFQSKLRQKNSTRIEKLYAKIFLEHKTLEKEIRQIESTKWAKDTEISILMKKYSKSAPNQEIFVIQLKSDLLLHYFNGIGKKYGLKYYFIEGLIKELGFQDLKYSKRNAIIRTNDFQYITIRFYDECNAKKEAREAICFFHYLSPIINSRCSSELVPVFEKRISKSKGYPNFEFLAYCKSESSLGLMLEHCKKDGFYSEDSLNAIFSLATSKSVGLLKAFYAKTPWDSPPFKHYKTGGMKQYRRVRGDFEIRLDLLTAKNPQTKDLKYWSEQYSEALMKLISPNLQVYNNDSK